MSRSDGTTIQHAMEHRDSFTGGDHLTEMVDTTMDPTRPRTYGTPVTTASLKVWRQILGLNPFKGSYFALFATLKHPGSRAAVTLGVVFAITAGIPLPIIGVIFGKIISGFPPSPDELQTRIEQLLGVAVAFFVVTSAYTIAFARIGEKIALELRLKLLSSLLHIDQAYLDTREPDPSTLIREKIDTIQVGCSEKVGIFIQSMAYFAAAFTVGFILNAKLTGILFAAVIPTMTMIIYFCSTATSKFTTLASKYSEQANATAESSLRAVRVLQAFDMMDEMCNSHQTYLKRSSKAGLRKAIVAGLQYGTVFFTAYAANSLAFYVGSHMAASDDSRGDAGTIYAVVFLILDASFVVGQFAPFLEIFARAASAFGKIQEVLEAPSASRLHQEIAAVDHQYDFKQKDIELQDVTFSYPARPTVRALNGLNLTLRAAAFNAIVGKSGGGKSTLVSLLLRLYEYSGTITIGTHDLRSLDPSYVRSQIAVLDQECILLAGTIYENICHGLVGQDLLESARMALCKKAATAAGLDFLDLLPNGIHTTIDSTLQLSGGQRQRVCLARALIKNPAILVLDEPTSALDAWSELKVMQAVKRAVENGTTVLMIAHRLSTVVDADTISVVSDGRVVEQGTPKELSTPGTIFRGLLDAQNTRLAAARPSMKSPSASSDDSDFSNSTIAINETEQIKREDTESGPKPTLRQIVTIFLRLSKPEHVFIVIGIFAATLSGCIILGEAIIFGNLVQLLNTERSQADFQSRANLFCLMFFVCALVALASYITSGIAFGIASNRLTNRVQATLLERILHLDIAWFSGSGRSVHELTSSLSKDSGDLACLSGIALGTIFTVIASVFGGIILAHAVAWKIAVVLLAAVPVMLASGYVRLRMLAKTETRQRTAYSEATALAIECCRSRKTVTALGLEQFCLDRYRKALQGPYRNGLASSLLCNTLLAFSLAITYFVYALAYWWGSRQVRSGLYSQRDFFTVLPALLFSAQAAGQLFSLSPEIARAKTAATSVYRLLSFRPTILQPPTDHGISHGTCRSTEVSIADPQHQKLGKLRFDNCTFAYPINVERKALEDVTLTIQDGETVALVGPSGAGKSSILALLERFYDPIQGRILFHGIDVRQMDVQQLRAKMALVPQDPEIFPGTISYNIQLGAAKGQTISQDMIEAVAKQCGLHNFIASLPDGYNTDCGTMNSSRLSGGQRQRLSLARALIRDPEVLILDEPTSALDATSEKEIQVALKLAAKGRTTIIVAHRLASIRDADRIVVFDNGRIVEQGTHAGLMNTVGLYASMAKAQALA